MQRLLLNMKGGSFMDKNLLKTLAVEAVKVLPEVILIAILAIRINPVSAEKMLYYLIDYRSKDLVASE